MKITEDIRQFAKEKGLTEYDALQVGMEEKSQEFKQKGSNVYS
jgi:phosphomethylpyrimidine synthase